MGRTNVGKSSLLNRMIGEERVIVSDVPGTTRDAIDTNIRYHGQRPGAHRHRRHPAARARWSRASKSTACCALNAAITRADVVLLLIDATDGVTAQDAHIAGYILDEAKSVIVLVNKWDVVEKDTHTLASLRRVCAPRAEAL